VALAVHFFPPRRHRKDLLEVLAVVAAVATRQAVKVACRLRAKVSQVAPATNHPAPHRVVEEQAR